MPRMLIWACVMGGDVADVVERPVRQLRFHRNLKPRCGPGDDDVGQKCQRAGDGFQFLARSPFLASNRAVVDGALKAM